MPISHTEDADATGNFEVFVAGTLAHSKAGGDGYVDTPAKLKALKRAVRDATAVEAVAGGGGLDNGVPTAHPVVDEGGERELLEDKGVGEEEEEEEEEESNASLIVSMLTLVLSIPALIGA